MLSQTVDGQPANEIKSLGHHNPIKNLAEQFRAITQTKRKDEPSDISSNYRAIRNLTMRMLEEAALWGGATLTAAPTGVATRAVREGATSSEIQFMNGYATVTLGYFFDGAALNETRINEDFSPWRFLGVWHATKEFFLPDLPPPSSTVRALRESASMATVACSIGKDIANIAQRLVNAKNVATVYGPRIALEALTSVEHELRKFLTHSEQHRTNQQSSVQIEEIGSSEVAPAQNSSSPLWTGNEAAISHIVEIAPTDTHDNSATPIETTMQSRRNQNLETAPSIDDKLQKLLAQLEKVHMEAIGSSEAALAQDSSSPLRTGNEEAVSHIVEITPTDTHDNPRHRRTT